ncbi:MAG TPA: polyprenyl synthetase family protein [Candidatus Sulfotelmatobacter sp.]|nr:polyprenyl synthetase family protein [Candidatus Sulfotelmatobacter sp.]
MSAPATINGKEVFDLLRDDLVALEDEFGRDTVSRVGAITEIGEYLRAGGGKRIRPALLLLSAKLLEYQGRGAVRLGAVVEIIHTATLVHDDIIDEAKTRRGRPAANTQWGNSKCVLAGDWLYMQAFKIAVQERNFRILDTLIELTQQMVEGELLQMEKLGKFITLEEHFDLIFRKTACLFSVCMRLGGILGGAAPEQESALGKYGHDLGMAFQIVDDVLDLTASEEVLGKPVASDLREGKMTMAVIHASERCTPEERRKIETILQQGTFNGVTHRDILDILERYGSLEAAANRAAEYAESARNAICTFPDSEVKRALLWAPEFVVAREK